MKREYIARAIIETKRELEYQQKMAATFTDNTRYKEAADKLEAEMAELMELYKKAEA